LGAGLLHETSRWIDRTRWVLLLLRWTRRDAWGPAGCTPPALRVVRPPKVTCRLRRISFPNTSTTDRLIYL